MTPSSEPFVQISEDDFMDEYNPQCNPSDGESLAHEFEDVKDKDPHHVWSVVESDDGETLYALPGFRVVNKIFYLVTEKPWPHENIEAVYLGPEAPAERATL